jgi:hypothetical protein
MSVSVQDSRRSSFFIIDNEVVDNYRLSGNALLAYMSICRCSRNGVCSFTLQYLADQVGIGRTVFSAAIAELETAGLLEVKSEKGVANVYNLLPVNKGPVQNLNTPRSESEHLPVQNLNAKNTNNNTQDNFSLATPEPKKGRRTKSQIFEPFSEEVKTVVNRVFEIWPHKRPGNNSKIQPDLALLAGRIDQILKNRELNAQLLIRSAERYLAEPHDFPHAPEYFFGPGKTGGDGPPWRHYARLEWYEQRKTIAMAAGVQ